MCWCVVTVKNQWEIYLQLSSLVHHGLYITSIKMPECFQVQIQSEWYIWCWKSSSTLFWSRTLTSMASLACGNTSICTPWTGIWLWDRHLNTMFHHQWWCIPKNYILGNVLQNPCTKWNNCSFVPPSSFVAYSSMLTFSCQDSSSSAIILQLNQQWDHINYLNFTTLPCIHFVMGALCLSSLFTSSLKCLNVLKSYSRS